MAQENLLKISRLIELLMYNDRMRRDTKALAQKVGVSQRTIQRTHPSKIIKKKMLYN